MVGGGGRETIPPQLRLVYMATVSVNQYSDHQATLCLHYNFVHCKGSTLLLLIGYEVA